MNVFNSSLLSFLSFVDIVSIVDVFKFKYINDAVIYHCFTDKDVIFVQNFFTVHNIRINTARIHDFRNESTDMLCSHSKIGVVVNTSCHGWINILESKISYQYPYSWIFITEDISSAVKVLSQYPIEVDADVIVAHKTKGYYLYYDVYSTGFKRKNGVFKTEVVGVWDNTLQMKLSRNRMDLTGVVLRCTVVVVQKLVKETLEGYLRQPTRIGQDSVHKLKYFTLLKYLRDMYNMSYELQRTNTWGYVRNGSMDGMVGALQHNEAEIGGSPVFFRIDRSKVLDYAAEIWPSRQSFIFRHPKYPSGFYTIYSRPLNNDVWLCILTLLVISGTILFFMLKLKTARVTGDDEDSSASLAFLFTWSAICQQGMSLGRSSSGVKVLVFITFVYSVTLYQYYNATVVSTLLREPPITIKTLKDLLHSNLKAGAEDVVYNKDFFKYTTDPTAIQIYKKKIASGNTYNFLNPENGMALVKRGGFAFHVDNVISYSIMKKTFTEREICETRDVTLYPPQKMAAVIKKRSPYRNHLVYGIRKMWESGVMQRLKSVWDEPKPECVQTPDSSIFSVSIREFSTPLLVLLFGMISSVVILITEIFFHRTCIKPGSFDFKH